MTRTAIKFLTLLLSFILNSFANTRLLLHSITPHLLRPSLPKLLVESLRFQLLDEAIVVKSFGLRVLGFGISERRLIQNLLNTLPRVIGDLVHVIDGVLVNRIECLGIRGAGV